MLVLLHDRVHGRVENVLKLPVRLFDLPAESDIHVGCYGSSRYEGEPKDPIANIEGYIQEARLSRILNLIVSRRAR